MAPFVPLIASLGAIEELASLITNGLSKLDEKNESFKTGIKTGFDNFKKEVGDDIKIISDQISVQNNRLDAQNTRLDRLNGSITQVIPKAIYIKDFSKTEDKLPSLNARFKQLEVEEKILKELLKLDGADSSIFIKGHLF